MMKKILLIMIMLMIVVVPVLATQKIYNDLYIRDNVTVGKNLTVAGNYICDNSSNCYPFSNLNDTCSVDGSCPAIVYNNTKTYQISVLWSNIIDKFITAVDNVYLYMSGTTVTLNETKLNSTINSINIAYNDSQKIYIDARDIEYNDNQTIYIDAQDVIYNDSMKVYTDNTFILQSEEGNLNVNSSVWWANLDGWMTDWFYSYFVSETIGNEISIIKNANFENTTGLEWSYTGGIAESSQAYAHTGNRSMSIRQTGLATTAAYQELSAYTNISLLSNSLNYTITGYVYIPIINTDTLYGIMSIGKGTGSYSEFFYYGTVNSSTSKGLWQEMTLDFTYDNSTDLYIGLFSANGTGDGDKLYWDDITITIEGTPDIQYYDLAFNESRLNTTISSISTAQNIIYNDSQKIYIDSQNIAFNDSQKVYIDSQDLAYNISQDSYINAQDIAYNDSQKTYIDNQDVVYNDSQKIYIDAINVSQATWVDTYFIRFTEIVGIVGNWSADKSDYKIWTDTKLYIDSIGNWTADKVDYYTSIQTDNAISDVNDSQTIYIDNQDIAYNDSIKVYTDNTFIAQSEEGNLNVNSSDYWDALDGPSDINAGDITDDGTYVKIIGDTMTGNLNMGNNDITGADDINGTEAYFTGLGEFSTLDTGQGANELYDMNQNVNTTDDVTFNAMTLTDDLSMSSQNIIDAQCLTLTNGQPICWNADARTIDIPTGTGVTVQVGQENIIYVKNKAGYDIKNGQAVIITGASGNTPTIGWADRRDSDLINVVGIATQDIDDNANGFITTEGLVRGIDTSGTPVGEVWLEGDKLYLGDEGNLTKVHPSNTSNAVIIVAIVVRPHAVVGSLLVNAPEAFTIGNDYNGILKQSVINKNTGIYAGSGFSAVNDEGHYVTFGIAGSNNIIFPNEVSILYAPGYGDQWQAVDGNKDFVWFTDPTDSHNNSALDNEAMRLYSEGNLEVQNNVTAGRFVVDGSAFTNLSKNEFINGPVMGIMQTGPSGQELPHFILQSGGSSQASVILRSVMIADEIAGFHNTTARTSCIEYMNNIGETLKIDCNTTTTGADLLVSDDMQVVGDVWIKDNSGEWHFMSKELNTLDSLMLDTTQGNLAFSHTDSVFNVSNANGKPLVINLNGLNYFEDNEVTVALNSGTNGTPAANYLTFQVSGSNAVLTNDASYPSSIAHSDIARIIKGDSGNVYLHLEMPTATKKFIYEIYDQATNAFEKYISGFSPDATTTNINFTSGEYWTVLKEFDSTNTLNMNSDGFFIVLNNGTFIQCTDLSCITEYNDGTSIAANAYFNVIWAVVPDSDNTSRLVAIPQIEPGSTYTGATTAEQDRFGTITFTINNAELTKHKLPLVRTIVKNNGDTFAAFENGLYYRNVIGLTPAGAAAGGTNDHSLLNNLDYASSGHTGFTNSIEFASIGNWTEDKSDYYTSTQVDVLPKNWTYLQNYPSACPANYYVQAVGDTLTCVNVVNGTEFVYSDYFNQGLNTTNNVEFVQINNSGDNIYIGSSEADHNIYFYEDGSSTGERFFWDNGDDRFEFTDEIYSTNTITAAGSIVGGAFVASGNIYTTSDIYTTGAGDDLWLGHSTQGSANFRAYADGSLITTTLDTGQGANELYDMDQNVLTTSDVIFDTMLITQINLSVDSTNHYIDDNATCIIIRGDTSTLNIC